MAKVKLETFDRDLPVALTIEEKATKGLDLAKLIHKRVGLTEKKRQFYAEMREEFLAVDEKIAAVEVVVRTGKEQRRVKCRQERDYKENKVIIVRLDTGEVVETRAMKPEERQQELELEKPKPKAADAA